jgi:signal peptidase I
MTINFNSPTWIFLRELSVSVDRFAIFMQKRGPQFTDYARKRKASLMGGNEEIEKPGLKISPEKLGANLPLALIIIYLGLVGIFTLAFYSESHTGIRVVSLTTGSMAPEIEPGTAVVTQEFGSYKEGDIVTFRDINPATGNALPSTTTHRIIRVSATNSGPAYITKGDANIVPDASIVRHDQILGKVVHKVRFLGYIIEYMKTFPGFLTLVVFPAAILIFNEIKYISMQMKEDKVVRKMSKEVLEF